MPQNLCTIDYAEEPVWLNLNHRSYDATPTQHNGVLEVRVRSSDVTPEVTLELMVGSSDVTPEVVLELIVGSSNAALGVTSLLVINDTNESTIRPFGVSLGNIGMGRCTCPKQ